MADENQAVYRKSKTSEGSRKGKGKSKICRPKVEENKIYVQPLNVKERIAHYYQAHKEHIDPRESCPEAARGQTVYSCSYSRLKGKPKREGDPFIPCPHLQRQHAEKEALENYCVNEPNVSLKGYYAPLIISKEKDIKSKTKETQHKAGSERTEKVDDVDYKHFQSTALQPTPETQTSQCHNTKEFYELTNNHIRQCQTRITHNNSTSIHWSLQKIRQREKEELERDIKAQKQRELSEMRRKLADVRETGGLKFESDKLWREEFVHMGAKKRHFLELTPLPSRAVISSHRADVLYPYGNSNLSVQDIPEKNMTRKPTSRRHFPYDSKLGYLLCEPVVRYNRL